MHHLAQEAGEGGASSAGGTAFGARPVSAVAARRFGTQSVLPLVVLGEIQRRGQVRAGKAGERGPGGRGTGARRYPAAAERGGSRHPAIAQIAERERWHRSSRGGRMRAAVFGINDGLVSNLALVLGVVAAGAERTHRACHRAGRAVRRRAVHGGG